MSAVIIEPLSRSASSISPPSNWPEVFERVCGIGHGVPPQPENAASLDDTLDHF